MKPGELVAREVVVGDASAGSKVPRVRPGVEGSDRYDEAKPVGRGDLASAPVLGQGDRHLAVHKSGVGLYQGLGTKVVLFDPTETPTSQRWGVLSNQRLQSDVAGVSDQRGAHAGRQVGDPRTSLAHVGEGVGKSCPCVHLEQQFRQVYLRQHPLGQRAELHETRWILESIQPGEDEFLAPACYLNPNRSVLPAEEDAWTNLRIRRHVASSLRVAYWNKNEAEAEKWRQRHTEAITKIEELEKARRQKRIEEHKAMIPQ